jgi:hypothetical protein
MSRTVSLRGRTIASIYAKLRKLWPAVKLVFFLLVVYFIGRIFYRDLTT